MDNMVQSPRIKATKPAKIMVEGDQIRGNDFHCFWVQPRIKTLQPFRPTTYHLEIWRSTVSDSLWDNSAGSAGSKFFTIEDTHLSRSPVRVEWWNPRILATISTVHICTSSGYHWPKEHTFGRLTPLKEWIIDQPGSPNAWIPEWLDRHSKSWGARPQPIGVQISRDSYSCSSDSSIWHISPYHSSFLGPDKGDAHNLPRCICPDKKAAKGS